MRKINKWLMVCVCALFSLTGCYNTEPRENVLKIYNWADYIDEDVLAEFPRWYKEQTEIGRASCRERVSSPV